MEQPYHMVSHCAIQSCHPKTGLKTFVDVIPQEVLAGIVPAKPSFGMAMTKVLIKACFRMT